MWWSWIENVLYGATGPGPDFASSDWRVSIFVGPIKAFAHSSPAQSALYLRPVFAGLTDGFPKWNQAEQAGNENAGGDDNIAEYG